MAILHGGKWPKGVEETQISYYRCKCFSNKQESVIFATLVMQILSNELKV